jgi:hypothetical protein
VFEGVSEKLNDKNKKDNGSQKDGKLYPILVN